MDWGSCRNTQADINTIGGLKMVDKRLHLTTLVKALRAAGEDTRLRLLHLLGHGELNVKDLTVVLRQSQPRISRHLKLLDEAGLVHRYREGSWVYCRLADRGRMSMICETILEQLDCCDQALASDLARLEALKSARAGEAERFFNAVADQWDKVRSLYISDIEVESAILRLVGDEQFCTMLDLGTGTGRMLELFADQIEQGIGIDISHTMLSHARTRLSSAGVGKCQLRHGDITNLSQERESVDLVMLHQVAHYFDDPSPVFGEVVRVLKPGGRFVMVDFSSHTVEFLREEYAHRRLGFSRDQVVGWFNESGLQLVDATDLNPAGGAKKSGLTVSIWIGELGGDGSADSGEQGLSGGELEA